MKLRLTTRCRRIAMAACAASVLVASVRAGAQLPDVAILASASVDASDAWFTDPQAKLVATGRFASVSIINAAATTPVLADLLAYDSVLVWSNMPFCDPHGMGDVLADYVDAGGGVVVSAFTNVNIGEDTRLLGRWAAENYNVLMHADLDAATGPAALGNVLDPAHPVMDQVVTFDGGSLGFRPRTDAELHLFANVAAEWDDGSVLVAEREDLPGRRIDLGFYPPSDDAFAGYWNAGTDGHLLLANALEYAAVLPVNPADFDVDGDVDLDDYVNGMVPCLTGPAPPSAPAPPCDAADLDTDGDVDLLDLRYFGTFFGG